MAGYSGTPLLKKLGYQPGDTIYGFSVPENIHKEFHKAGLAWRSNLPTQWAHGFFNWMEELDEFLDTTDLSQIQKALWVSWPKKAAKVPTDLTEQTFRDKILPLGWVDIKVAAI